jgi:hypothetical protein
VILDQHIEPVQILGAMVVVAAVVFLGLRRQP